jgi:hypothetical protein
MLLVLLTAFGLTLSCARQQQNPVDHSTIKIGFFGDLSGPTFNYGQSAMNGVLMAADEINQATGINGHNIDVVIADEKGSPEAAALAVGKLRVRRLTLIEQRGALRLLAAVRYRPLEILFPMFSRA